MAHIFTLWDLARGAVTHAGLVSVASFYWAIVSLASVGGGGGEGREGGQAAL